MSNIAVDGAKVLLLAGLNAGVCYMNSKFTEMQETKARSAAAFGAASTLTVDSMQSVQNAANKTPDVFTPAVAIFGSLAVGIIGFAGATVVRVVSGFFAGKMAAAATGNPIENRDIAKLTGIYAMEALIVGHALANSKQ